MNVFKNPQGCGFLIQSTCYWNLKNKKMKPESPEIKECKYKSWSAGTNVGRKMLRLRCGRNATNIANF
jgi:hypothetical protein